MSSSIVYLINGFNKAIGNLDFYGKTMADLGCGFGKWTHLIRSDIDKHGDDAYIIGCDIHRAYLEKIRKYNPYDELLVCDAGQLPFKPKSLNFIMAFEMIEHMDKKEGLKLLGNIETIAQDIIIVSTPSGRFEQGKIRNNPYETHLSAWYPQDFLQSGFAVSKCGLGPNLEELAEKLKIFSLLQKMFQILWKTEWCGVMIFATKQLNERT